MRRLLPLPLVLAALAPAAAAEAKLKPGIYDCMGTSSGYVNSIKIMSGGKYVYASARKGRTLKRTTNGRYRLKGDKITWLSGTFKKAGYTSKVYAKYFSLDRRSDGVWTGISCYFQPHPESGTQGI